MERNGAIYWAQTQQFRDTLSYSLASHISSSWNSQIEYRTNSFIDVRRTHQQRKRQNNNNNNNNPCPNEKCISNESNGSFFFFRNYFHVVWLLLCRCWMHKPQRYDMEFNCEIVIEWRMKFFECVACTHNTMTNDRDRML